MKKSLLYHNSFGKGKKVLLIHGFLETHQIFHFFSLTNWNKEFFCIDLPGHGQSDFNLNSNNLTDIALQIINEFPWIIIEEVDLVGHSLGAYIAIEIHKRMKNPGKLVFYHSHFLGDNDERKKKRDKAILLVQYNKSSFIRESFPFLFMEKNRKKEYVFSLIQQAKNIDLHCIVFYLQAMKNRENETKYISSIKEKVFFIHGEHDTLLSDVELSEINKILPILEIQDVAHMSFFENKKDTITLFKKIL